MWLYKRYNRCIQPVHQYTVLCARSHIGLSSDFINTCSTTYDCNTEQHLLILSISQLFYSSIQPYRLQCLAFWIVLIHTCAIVNMRCVAMGCSNSVHRSGNWEEAIGLHNFPNKTKEPHRWQKWVSQCLSVAVCCCT